MMKWTLIAEANPRLTLQVQPSWLLPSLQPPAAERQLTPSRYIMPPSQPSDGSYHGMHAPNPQGQQLQWPHHSMLQFQSNDGSYHGMHAPNPQGFQLQWPPYIMHQFQPSYVSYHGMHAPNPPIGQIGDFQSLNVGPSVFHGSGVPEMHNQMQGHFRGSLHKLDMEISELLNTLGTHTYRGLKGETLAIRHVPVAIEQLPRLYLQKYWKPMLAEGCLTASEWDEVTGFSLTRVLMRLASTRVLERQDGQYYISTHGEYARPRYRPLRRVYLNRSNKVFINIRTGRLADEELNSYFEHFGPVIMVQTFCRRYDMIGFVCFLYNETPELVFKERKKCSIRGIKIFVQQYEENHERSITRWSG